MLVESIWNTSLPLQNRVALYVYEGSSKAIFFDRHHFVSFRVMIEHNSKDLRRRIERLLWRSGKLRIHPVCVVNPITHHPWRGDWSQNLLPIKVTGISLMSPLGKGQLHEFNAGCVETSKNRTKGCVDRRGIKPRVEMKPGGLLTRWYRSRQ